MGDYLTILWDVETPTAKAVEWDNCLLVVHGDEASLIETEIVACTADDWSTQLTDLGFAENDQGYKSVANFFAATPTPGGTLYVLALVSGQVDIYQDVPMRRISSTIYETTLKPPLGFYGDEEVKYFPNSSLTGFFINAADGSAGVAFDVEEDANNDWTGRLTFSNGLSGVTIDSPPKLTGKVLVSFRIGKTTADISEAIEKYGMNMMAASYVNSKTKTDFSAEECYFGSQSEDLLRFSNAIAGKSCELFWNTPGNISYGESGLGFSVLWENLINFVGAREDVSLINIKPSSSNHDMAAGTMGMVAGTHPHTTMSFARPHMGIQEPMSLIGQTYFNNGQIITVMQQKRLTGNPYLFTHGFTLGSGYSSRINYVRCKYIISNNLQNGLWELFASRKVKMSYSGMQLVKNKIFGIFKTLQDQGIHDGLAYVKIPIEIDLKDNTAAGQAARLAYTIPSIEIGFYWYSSLEKIIITGIRNEA